MKPWATAFLAAALALPLAWAQDAPPAEPAVGAAEETVEAQPEAAPEEVPQPPPPVLPLQLRCGQLIKVEAATSVSMVDLAKMVEDGKLKPDPNALPDTTQRTASSGQVFAVAELRLAAGQSVGKTDFVLLHGSERSECLALAEGVGAFDERQFELKKSTVRLLFVVQEGTESVQIAYAPQLRVPLPASRAIPFGEQASVAVPAPEESAPTVVAAPAAAPAKPEAEAKPEPKPAPKPEPKKPADTGVPLF